MMLPEIKSEIRKLLTLRINYALMLFALLGIVLYAASSVFSRQTAQFDALQSQFLANSIETAIGIVAVLASIIALLQFTRDYRHNTIMYALTLSNSRTKVFVAKIVVMSGFAVLFTLFAGILAPLLADLAIHTHQGITLAPQQLNLGTLARQTLLFGWASTMLGFIVGALIRNQLGSVVTLLIFPTTIEPLLGLELGDKARFLPFNALFAAVGQSSGIAKSLSPASAAWLVTLYIAIGWIAAWVLFVRRDAN